MKWNLVALANVPPQPWRNGGGATRELLAHPGPANWRVRMSVADVHAAGPFSRFEGIERWFAVLEGAGVVLRLAGEERLLTRGDPPLRFDGGVPVHCTLFTGATRDFNLMAAPGRAQMWRVRGRRSFGAEAGTLLAVYGHDEDAQLEFAGGRVLVPARYFAWTLLEQPGTGVVASDHALWMEVKP